ncbi:hypothetical protein BUALT_Bualt06G0086500 [Buddleja alternifolia]|uniref:AAA+ ATPase domain-containing protein n=1 Tax=Buddleja alternifolia TaxID=168488 RepID=A0AAV6XLL1_9LAMI|nr:hypothetical protein BUALT_Bualt06G0086500 [Buddleja alternifolia]
MRGGSSETKIVQELILYAASAALSCLVLFVGLKHLDPNREASKKALEHKKEIAKRLGRPLIQTNPMKVKRVISADVVACDVVNPDHIDVKFESIGGLDAIKEELYELVILPLKRPELFARGKLLCPQKGVLLYGPPGTGKTMLAKAIAKESGAVFINVRISNLMSKWFGDAQKLVAAVFSLAYKLQPAIIFIDEVDSFLGTRKTTDHEALTNMKTEFMALWDGFTTDQHARVMVLAATNRPSELDEAILRRLPQAFEIGIPDRKERAEILKVILKNEKVENGVDYDRIAALCDGYTGSDLLDLCKKAAYFPIRDLLNDEKTGKPSPEPRLLSQSDLERVIATTTKTKVAASEYNRSNPWTLPRESGDDYQVQAAINELSKIVASQIFNLQSDAQDSLADGHLGLKDHKLFSQVEEIFQTGASLSTAEVCEIMISNRSSPSWALKTIITALQGDLASRLNRRLNGSGSSKVTYELGGHGDLTGRVERRMNRSESGRVKYVSEKEGQSGIHPIKEIKNLYGYLRTRSSRKGSIEKLDIDVHEKENSYSIHGI